jgi:serine/threonine protein kinase
MFELLSGGIILFRPPSIDENESKEEVQLKMMVNLCGEIPKEMIREGVNSKRYFDQRGKSQSAKALIIGRFRVDNAVPRGSSFQRVFEILKKRSESKTWRYSDLPPEDIPVVEDLLSRMLEISPKKRATSAELRCHKWFQDISG